MSKAIENMIPSVMTPRETTAELDKHIVGQAEAKRAVAIALRNRWRRMNIEDAELRNEIMPKNILMIGPTGVGKTEIARRLAKLADAPFIKVEATKFTEVGYVGKDVDSIIRDLADTAVKQMREKEMKRVEHIALDAAEERVLDSLLQTAKDADDSSTRQVFRKKLREGELDDHEIEIEISASLGVEIMAPPGMEDLSGQIQSMFQNLNSGRTHMRKVKVIKAMDILKEEEAAKLINEDEIKLKALENVEENGMVFIDEIDKVCRRSDGGTNGDVSREGVQRDLLPLVEGTTVTTKYGMIKTDHILFIASGAFHVAKPSDLTPELQGRLPIRVELNALSADDFEKILIDPKASLTKQYTALMGVEGVTLEFKADGVRRIAECAFQVNEKTENIGARRLHTMMERLLDEMSFDASDKAGESLVIDEAYVNQHLANIVGDEDLARYIL